MPRLIWDASALSKRYYKEAGTDTVVALFSAVVPALMATTYIGYAETAFILRRKFNSGLLDPFAFRQARLALDSEVLLRPEFRLLTAEDSDYLAGVSLSDRHNLNTSDAAILSTTLRYKQSQSLAASPYVLVSADRRLLRAAAAEGLHVLNPELVPAADVPALLRRF